MPTLYEIGADLQALEALLLEMDGEITEIGDDAERALNQWFAELGEARDQKLDSYSGLIREIEARRDARAAEAKRLQMLAASDEKNAKRLRDRLRGFLVVQGVTRIETTRFRIAMQKNGGKAPLAIPLSWEQMPATAPEAFHRRVIELDKEAIRKALEAGDEVPGCAIGERGSHLVIK